MYLFREKGNKINLFYEKFSLQLSDIELTLKI